MAITMTITAGFRPKGFRSPEKEGDADERPGPKANELPLRQVEHHLGLYFRQVFRHGYIGQ